MTAVKRIRLALSPRARAWERRKAELIEQAWAEWDSDEGICGDCGLPMRLHPRERLLSCSPAFCAVAAESGTQP